ncbi:MAG: exodeoxyribonuclease VII large subunit, partial [Betaproteobacteria bacterium AqS2]|nr:exodeoxyribonuclease VII large subunit [Betaproteobacteria bacterium AqS2]
MESDFPDETAAAVTVSDLLHEIHGMLASAWPADIWVLGEFSNVRSYPSGHFYMTLKDEDGEVSCVLFKGDAARLRQPPAEGVAVAVRARPELYAKKGQMQLIIREIRIQGQGRLHEEYLRRKEELRRHGWFDEARKQPIPRVPRGIGVVASAEGAVWKDIRTTLAQRFANIPVKLYRAPAQGEGAAAKIGAQIARADADPACEVILVCRGGGSFEDLWAYSEASVVKAIHASATPVIAGIGHDSDESLADHVADLRAATPTAAAVAATAVTRAELLDACAGLRERLGKGARGCVAAQADRLNRQGNELRHAVRETVSDVQMRLDRLEYELDKGVAERLAQAGARLRELGHGLGAAVRRLLDRLRGL